MSRQGKFWEDVEKKGKKNNPDPVQIGEIVSLNPFVISFLGIEIGKKYGDTIYINHLILDENINLNKLSMDLQQNITDMSPKPWIAMETPHSDYTAYIWGTQKQFLIDFYDFFKAVHNRYILHEGDYVAVQKLGNNTYIVVEKVQKVDH